MTLDQDIIKEKLLYSLNTFRIHYKSPIHVHSYKDLPDMAVKQCIICNHIEEVQAVGFYTPMDIAPGEYPEDTTESPEWYLDTERANVPEMRKRRSGRLYEAHKDNIRLVLSHHGVLTNDGWGFVTDELIEDLAGVK